MEVRFGLALVLGFAMAGCAAKNPQAPVRSPSRDYQPPPAQTSDGRVVGADGVEPRDRLEEGAHGGTDNALSPGWEVDKEGIRHDPKKRVGGSVDEAPDHEH